MPEVRVQLSDEQVERLRKRSAWSRASVADDVLDACAGAVREQLPPPIKVGDKVRWARGTGRVFTVIAVDGAAGWIRDGSLGSRYTFALSDLVRVEEGE